MYFSGRIFTVLLSFQMGPSNIYLELMFPLRVTYTIMYKEQVQQVQLYEKSNHRLRILTLKILLNLLEQLNDARIYMRIRIPWSIYSSKFSTSQQRMYSMKMRTASRVHPPSL